jgi:nickel-dependent lactate racemase
MLQTEGNPVLGLNVVIDDQRQLSFVSYGDIVASHESAVEYVRQFAVVPVCVILKVVIIRSRRQKKTKWMSAVADRYMGITRPVRQAGT